MRPILFLDIDGVLNSAEYLTAERCRRSNWGEMLCPQLCERLEKVLQATGAQVVLSSSWRYHHSIEQVEKLIRERGAPSIEIISQTPTFGETEAGIELFGRGGRGNEIQAWLNRNPTTRFAVVDDSDCTQTDAVTARFVQTSWHKGLEDSHVDQLICLLKGEDQ